MIYKGFLFIRVFHLCENVSFTLKSHIINIFYTSKLLTSKALD